MLATRKPSGGGPHGFVTRINAATPPGRDRVVDAVRAFAILGVVLGHWLVTVLVATGDGGLRVASPLKEIPALTPISWVLQTLAVFFFVGGYTAAKGYKPGDPWASWMRRRLTRLLRPVPILLVAWVPAVAALVLYGGYPASMVGVPGVEVSNLNPPTLAAVTFGAFAVTGAVSGLHTPPDHPGWALDRLLWLPVFAAALAGLLAFAHRFERSSGS